MSPTCRDMSPTTHRVAPILARWVRVADTIFSMSWEFVSARADIYLIFRNSYVEIYYGGMGVHTHRYSQPILSCSPVCHVLQFVMIWRETTHTHTTPTRENTKKNSITHSIRDRCLIVVSFLFHRRRCRRCPLVIVVDVRRPSTLSSIIRAATVILLPLPRCTV